MALPRHRVIQGQRGHRGKPARQRIRYAIVGLGHIAQESVLPAFSHASRNSEIGALFSEDAAKLRNFGKTYGVENLYSYDEFEQGLREADIDAVYLALPNHLHETYTVRAARERVHVLCEKPLAVTAKQCKRMISECRRNKVKLMTAYRLHFEPANLEAIGILQSGQLGEPRIFGSLFSFQVAPGNIRLKTRDGGGTLYDIGTYCINAARYLFRDEPLEVLAITAAGRDRRFKEIEETTSAMLRFPKDRLATFTCSFGVAEESRYEVLCTKGAIRVSHAYEYVYPIEVEIFQDGQTRIHTHKRRDQFAPELIYFSDCILQNREPEPGGVEGLADVQIIEALYRSARTRRPVRLTKLPTVRHPRVQQRFSIPPAPKPKLLHVAAPSRD
jgi:glucose-fructose oxidoreductase